MLCWWIARTSDTNADLDRPVQKWIPNVGTHFCQCPFRAHSRAQSRAHSSAQLVFPQCPIDFVKEKRIVMYKSSYFMEFEWALEFSQLGTGMGSGMGSGWALIGNWNGVGATSSYVRYSCTFDSQPPPRRPFRSLV